MSAPTTPLSPGSPAPYLHQVVVGYVPELDGEIRLLVGEVIASVKDLGNGWTLGKNVSSGNQVGIFPSSCIRPLASFPAPAPPGAHHPLRGDTADVNAYNDALAELDEYEGTAAARMLPPSPSDGARRQVGAVERAPRRADGRCSRAPRSRYDRRDELLALEGYLDVATGGSVLHSVWSNSFDDDVAAPPSTNASTGGPASVMEGQAAMQQHQQQRAGEDVIDYRYFSDDPAGWCVKKPRMIVKPHLDTGGQEQRYRGEDEQELEEAYAEEGDYRAAAVPTAAFPKCRTAAPPCDLHLRSTVVPHGYSDPDEDQRCAEESVYETSRSETDPRRGSANCELGKRNGKSTMIGGEPPLPKNCDSFDEHYAQRYYRDYRAVELQQGNFDLCEPACKDYDSCRAHADPPGRCHQVGRPDPSCCACRPIAAESINTSYRLVVSLLVGLLSGLALFLWMFFHLDYALLAAGVVAGVTALLAAVLLALSRACRCTAALLLPSVSTSRGRLACLVLLSGCLLSGPVTNVYVNMAEVSRSMSCSAEQSYNQTNFLLSPFDAMMRQLNLTIARLQEASHNVSRGLRPLDEGLASVEDDLYNGKLQLLGTRKTCRALVERAFNACAAGIHKAQDQCLGVMGALGTVYHHARVVLDRIKPDRWSTKGGGPPGSQGSPGGHSGGAATAAQLHKRQVIDEASVMEDIELSASDGDICEPLDTLQVCHALNDSDQLCQPARWAGEAIQDAINATQRAMLSLRQALQFYVTSEPYSTSRSNASALSFHIRRRVQEEFAARTRCFQYAVDLLRRAAPLALLLLLHAAYTHLRLYISRDTYDNVYVTRRVDDPRGKGPSGRLGALDGLRGRGCERAEGCRRGEGCARGVLPLRPYERRYLVDTTTRALARPERGRHCAGLGVLLLHALLSAACCAFDCVLYWVLALVQRHGRPGFDSTGGDSLQRVLTGNGIIVELLDVFLKGFHPDHGFSFIGDTQSCLPVPRAPSVVTAVSLGALYLALLATVLLQAYVLRLRCAVTGYFYRERERARFVYLRGVILGQRARLPTILHHAVRANHQATLACALFPCRARLLGGRRGTHRGDSACRCRPSRCLVCSGREAQLRECKTEECPGRYCRDCWDDLQRVCPLCLHYVTTTCTTADTLTCEEGAAAHACTAEGCAAHEAQGAVYSAEDFYT